MKFTSVRLSDGTPVAVEFEDKGLSVPPFTSGSERRQAWTSRWKIVSPPNDLEWFMQVLVGRDLITERQRSAADRDGLITHDVDPDCMRDSDGDTIRVGGADA